MSIPIDPIGYLLKEEFLKCFEISTSEFAELCGISHDEILSIVYNQKSITVDNAIRFSKVFGNSWQFWIGLENDYQYRKLIKDNKNIYDQIKPIK